MSFGPIQAIIFGFEQTDQMRGQVLSELLRLRGRGVIRVVDLLFAKKDADGLVNLMEMSDLSQNEQAELGLVAGALLGLSPLGEDLPAPEQPTAMEALQGMMGLTAADLQAAINDLGPNSAFGLLVIEHLWAVPLQAALREVGAKPLAQGLLTRETVVLAGRELAANAAAEAAITRAATERCKAILARLSAGVEGETAAPQTAAVLRALIEAGVIDDAAVPEAVDALVAAGLLPASPAETESH